MNKEMIILKDSIPVQHVYAIRRKLTQWDVVFYDNINSCNPIGSRAGASDDDGVRQVLLVTGCQDDEEYDGYYEEYNIPYFGYGEDYRGDALCGS